jgi:REP element-mobilizing transposase RayT
LENDKIPMNDSSHINNNELFVEKEDDGLKGFGTVGVNVGVKQANREIGVPGMGGDSGKPLCCGRGYLHHFNGHGAIQHVTFHLEDSLPKDTLERLKRGIEFFPSGRRDAELRIKIENWIDSGSGSCILRKPEIARMVQEALLFFHGQRYELIAWAVMPNHVHVLFQAINGWAIPKIVASWKKFTAKNIHIFRTARPGHANLPIGLYENEGSSINSLKSNTKKASPDPVWHREYWDRYIRNERHFLQVIEYIHMNPVKAGLVLKPGDWLWSSANSQSGDWRARGDGFDKK